MFWRNKNLASTDESSLVKVGRRVKVAPKSILDSWAAKSSHLGPKSQTHMCAQNTHARPPNIFQPHYRCITCQIPVNLFTLWSFSMYEFELRFNKASFFILEVLQSKIDIWQCNDFTIRLLSCFHQFPSVLHFSQIQCTATEGPSCKSLLCLILTMVHNANAGCILSYNGNTGCVVCNGITLHYIVM